MESRRRRNTQIGVSLHFGNAAKNLSTAQGQYTLYALVICAIIGIVLNRILLTFMSSDLAILIAFGITGVLLIISLLKMKTIGAKIGKYRLEAFNRRVQERRESNNTDG